MDRRKIVGTAVAVTLLVLGCLLYGYLQQPADASAEYSEWSPNPAAIQRRIGTAARPAPGMTEAERRTQFCNLFKGRFRHHDPAVAVGLRFLSPTRIKLMVPARMEPCYMDRIALEAWHEARGIFGAPIDIDIYDTFIGTTQIKIGQLRATAENSEVAHVSYDFRQLIELTSPRVLPIRPLDRRRAPNYQLYFGRRASL
jgi:hypothetical protein